MKRSEVTAEAMRKMGYIAMAEFSSWTGRTEKECNERQSTELFEAVAKAARTGRRVEIRRNHVRGTVIAHIDGTHRNISGTDIYYFLQRPMTDAEIMEESIRSGLWVTNKNQTE